MIFTSSWYYEIRNSSIKQIWVWIKPDTIKIKFKLRFLWIYEHLFQISVRLWLWRKSVGLENICRILSQWDNANLKQTLLPIINNWHKHKHACAHTHYFWNKDWDVHFLLAVKTFQKPPQLGWTFTKIQTNAGKLWNESVRQRHVFPLILQINIHKI